MKSKRAIPAQVKPVVSLREIRQAIADYMHSEGCSCCEDMDAHNEHKKRIAKLLRVPEYFDKSGYNFVKFRTKES